MPRLTLITTSRPNGLKLLVQWVACETLVPEYPGSIPGAGNGLFKVVALLFIISQIANRDRLEPPRIILVRIIIEGLERLSSVIDLQYTYEPIRMGVQ